MEPKGPDGMNRLRPDVMLDDLRNAAPRRERQLWKNVENQEGLIAEESRGEFPEGFHERESEVGRRDILKLMAASAALAGLTGCTKLPLQKITPYVRQPEEIIPGKALYYATSMTLGGVATGILVESHMARPTKIEGNPDHPASLGATDAFAQAAVLSLYDPDRSQTVLHDGRIAGWGDFQQAAQAALAIQHAKQGSGLRILTETITSPSLGDALRSLLTAFPAAKWHQYESISRDAAREGAKLAFGEYANSVYRLDHADVVLALDSDFLCSGPGCVRYARDFAGRRAIDAGAENISRLYAVEATPTNTGAKADHCLRLRAGDVESFARMLASQLGMKVTAGGPIATPVPAGWIESLARDLQQHAGASLVIAGDQQPPMVHALAHAINHQLGNFDKTVYFTEPIEQSPVNQWESLRNLTSDLRAGRVEALVILGGNPVYDAPADFDLQSVLPQVPFSARLGLYEDETSAACHWHIPATHFLEEWGDARAFDGTVSMVQPLIAPLYGGKPARELIALLGGQPGKIDYEIVREYWRSKQPTNFDATWTRSLRSGVMAGSAFPAKTVSMKGDIGSLPTTASQPGLEIIFRPDPATWDGRFANNGWLQEWPKPLTKITWDAVAMFSPKTAARLNLKSEDTVELGYQGRSVRAPVWVMPGHADETVTAFLGYGRRQAGRIGTGVGFDAGWIRPFNTPWFGTGLEVRKTRLHWPLASTQDHSSMEGRDFIRVASLAEYKKNSAFAQADANPNPESLYPPVKYEGYQWGMAIDLNACTGCGSCVVACQAENNIAVVGKTEVLIGREMHWLRIDRYYEGSADDPSTYYEPVLCMQCENAPCEVVCPVGATVHSPEGLNDMVYNRCVGTRYCSNNCPYKVRHFNFRLYSDWNTESLFALRNPNVTVRSRGVMEKCTYCVQRINAVKIEAEKADRPIRDGEIVTACQQSCPSQALVFGNITDANSRVSRMKAKNLNYTLLEELNTRPRTSYLARLHNPNPQMPEQS